MKKDVEKDHELIRTMGEVSRKKFCGVFLSPRIGGGALSCVHDLTPGIAVM